MTVFDDVPASTLMATSSLLLVLGGASQTISYAAAFRRRWGIETSYRQLGDFLPRTSSPAFSVRLFYFLFAVSLYNLWVLVNVFASAETVPETPLISTRIFRRFVLSTDYG